jgi:4-amino-4-deoxy-L-arabinose transferase-like glycosyltransferase
MTSVIDAEAARGAVRDRRVRNSRFAIVIGAIVLVALAARLGAIAVTPHIALASDPADYARHASSISAGHGYPSSAVVRAGGPTAIRPPAYPYLLAGVYKVAGHSVLAGRVAQAVIGAAIVGVIALIALELFGPLTAVVAGVLAAVFPPLIVDGMTLLSDPLFVLLEVTALLTALRWRATGRPPWLIASGVLAGLSILTRQNGELLLIPLLFAVRRPGPWRSAGTYKAPVALLACAALIVVPWTIRNAVEMHAFVPVSDQDGYTLAGTYNATSQARNGEWITANQDPSIARLIARSPGISEVDLDGKLRSAARHYAVEHPGYLGTVAVHNGLRLFNLAGTRFAEVEAGGDYGLGAGWGKLLVYGFYPFLLLALLGLATRAARSVPLWLWAIPVLMLTTVMVLADNRTRAPIDPFILLLAAFAVAAVIRRPAQRYLSSTRRGANA